MGNGTTAIAAKSSYRHFLGFEINLKLQSIIENSISKTTLGHSYIPYSDKPDELVRKARERFGKK